eukprot:COSAG05_NODE_16424_length_346_cov_1.028340_1_plen_23_part_10
MRSGGGGVSGRLHHSECSRGILF